MLSKFDFIKNKILGQVQDLAIRCIQRNVRKFLAIRSWTWWRLYIKVLPLLNVHRTEEDLRLKTVSVHLLVCIIYIFICTRIINLFANSFLFKVKYYFRINELKYVSLNAMVC